jgi:tape measure domain-containing protein
MDIERVVVRLMADASQYNRVMAGAEGRLMVFARNATFMGNALSTPFFLAAGAVGAFTFALIGSARAALTSAASYEQAAVALEVMMKNADEAKRLFIDLQTLAVETPFRTPELLEGAKQLKAFGFENDQIIKTLHALGEVSSGTGTRLERIILAFGQIRVAGRLMGPELRQLVDAGVPMFEYLAKVMNKPVTAIKGLVEEGKVSYPFVVRAFNMMTQEGGLFFGLMDRQSRTAAGRWSAFVETMEIGLRDMGLAFFRGFGVADFLEDMRVGFSRVTGNRDELTKFFQEVRAGFNIIVGLLAKVQEWVRRNEELILSVAKFIAVMVTLRIGLAATRMLMAVLLIPLNMMIMSFGSILRIVGIVGAAFLIFDDFPASLEEMANWIKKISSNMTEVMNVVKPLIMILVGLAIAISTVRFALIALRTVWMVTTAIMAAGTVIWTALTFIATTVTSVAAIASLASSLLVIGGALTAILAIIANADDLFPSFIGRMRALFDDMAALFGKTLGGIRDAIKAGDFELAGRIAFTGLEVAFRKVVEAMREEWIRFSHWWTDKLHELGIRGKETPLAFREGGKHVPAEIAQLEADIDRFEKLRATPERQLTDVDKMVVQDLDRLIADSKKRLDIIGDTKIWDDQSTKMFREETKLLDTLKRDREKIVGRPEYIPSAATLADMRKELAALKASGGSVLEYELYKMRAPSRAAEDRLNRQIEEARSKAMQKEFGAPYQGGFAPGVTPELAMTGLNTAIPAFDTLGKVLPPVAVAFRSLSGTLGSTRGPDFFQLRENVPGIDTRYGPMREPIQLSSEALEVAKDLRREMAKELDQGIGMVTGRIEHYYKRMDELNEAFYGPLFRFIKEGAPQLAALVNLPEDLKRGNISPEEHMFGVTQLFEARRRRLGGGQEVFPRAMARDTAEAQDTINRQGRQQTSVLEEVRDVMLRTEQLERDALQKQKELYDAILRIEQERKAKPPEKVGGFFGGS